MVTFARLRHAALEPLDRAADTWNGISGHAEQIATEVRFAILRPLTGSGGASLAAPESRAWTGAAANEAGREIGLLADELSAFHYEALAITAALRRARSAFAEAQRKLLRAIGDAEALGATVSEDGTVTLPPLPPEERNDTDSIAHQRRKWDELQHHVEDIRKAVAAATEADITAASALRAINPDEVDPATHGDAVQNAKADLTSAVGIPKNRADVPGWWASLDPVVRAGLLTTSPGELAAAGVMGPTEYQWAAPDNGTGPFGTREPGADDRLSQLSAYGLVSLGPISGYPDAGRHLLHYLDGSGEPLNVDVDRMLRDDDKFRGQVELELAANDARWRQAALAAYEKSGGAAVAIPVETPNSHRTFDREAHRNWYLAVGSHAYVSSGVVTAKPGPDGKVQISMQYQVNVWDRYNWDPTKATPIAGANVKDSDLAKLHETGLAQEFDIRGASTTMTRNLGDGAPVHPSGTGERNSDREGDGTDPDRETR
ncbi:hypothetical protein ACFVVX_17720 [Kitasatospora sp. NPDC058170]|uniref:hypothetical protein n=1 Tax=Kitasatospora sp. NPDC058170 TaxID=3346364 RepID=UPI0036D9EC92